MRRRRKPNSPRSSENAISINNPLDLETDLQGVDSQLKALIEWNSKKWEKLAPYLEKSFRAATQRECVIRAEYIGHPHDIVDGPNDHRWLFRDVQLVDIGGKSLVQFRVTAALLDFFEESLANNAFVPSRPEAVALLQRLFEGAASQLIIAPIFEERGLAGVRERPDVYVRYTVQLGSASAVLDVIVLSMFVGTPPAAVLDNAHLANRDVETSSGDAEFKRASETLLDKQNARAMPELYQRGPIGSELSDEQIKALPLRERLEELDQFAKARPEILVSSLITRFFPEFLEHTVPLHNGPKILPLPKRAPERWPTNPDKRNENPAEFATRVYKQWMDAGVLTRQDLKRLDPLLFSSLENWEKNNRRKPTPSLLPDGFRLLTIDEANNAWIDRIRAGELEIPTDPDEMARLGNALRYRALEADKGRKR